MIDRLGRRGRKLRAKLLNIMLIIFSNFLQLGRGVLVEMATHNAQHTNSSDGRRIIPWIARGRHEARGFTQLGRGVLAEIASRIPHHTRREYWSGYQPTTRNPQIPQLGRGVSAEIASHIPHPTSVSDIVSSVSDIKLCYD